MGLRPRLRLRLRVLPCASHPRRLRCERYLDTLEGSGSEESRAEVLLTLAHLYLRESPARTDDAVAMLERALDFLPAAAPALLARIVAIHMDRGDLKEAIRTHAKAIASAESVGDDGRAALRAKTAAAKFLCSQGLHERAATLVQVRRAWRARAASEPSPP